MSDRPRVHSFSATLQRMSAKGGSHLVVVPEDVAAEVCQGERRGRAVVTLLTSCGEDGPTWHAGLNPYGGGRVYVQVGRNYHEPLGFQIGDELSLKLARDTSTYGMRPCEEFAAVSESDPAGTQLFQTKLTGGTQRSILHRIANGRTSDARIARAIRIFDQMHLGVTDRQALLRSIRADAMASLEEM